MLIARELKKSNISEYLIYMFQVEDLIRLNNCEIEKVEESIISQFKLPEDELTEVRKWYESLCRMMNEEGVKEKGHLQFIINQINELTEFHIRLMELTDDNNYSEAYNLCKSDLETFRNKIPSKPESDIEVCLYALYSLLLMRLKKMSLTPDTHEAMTNFSAFMANLSKKYLQYESGKLEIF